MSILQEFLIKSAGMEKEAKRAFRKLLERGMNKSDLLNMIRYRLFPAKRLAAFRDLTTPLKDRTSAYYRSTSGPARFKLADAYENYLNRVVRNSKDPHIVDYLKYKRKSKALSRFAPQMESDVYSVLESIIFSPEISSKAAPNILYKYKVKTPYTTTHHLANPEASLQANARALETPNDVTYIRNLDPNQGWKNWRSAHFRVNRPGQRWTDDEMHQLLTSDDLSNTPLYETVFTKGSKEFPSAISAYVPDTPEVRKALDIPESVESIPAVSIQDPLTDFVYKGMRMLDSRETAPGVLQGLRYGLREMAPDRYRNNNSITSALYKWADDLGLLSDDGYDISPHRWFAPAAKTSAGYIGAADKNLIRLDANALAKYRKLVVRRQDELNTAIQNLFGEMSESQLSDLIRAAIREHRITKLRRAYENRSASTGLQNPVRDVLSLAVDKGF